MSTFERYLTIWKEHWRGIGVTLFINWAVKPFSMALLGWLFIGWLFRPYLPADQIDSYIAGLILLAAAPCTAMVFVWSNLSDGEPHFTLSQVALNDVIMVFAFAPIVGLLLGLSAITVPWQTLLLSVVLYIVVPVIIAQIVRRSVMANGGSAALTRLLSTANFACGVARDAGAPIRLSGRTNPRTATNYRHFGGADPDTGLFQFRSCLSSEPRNRGGALRGGAIRTHRR
jgi:ACR3 family arsenite efflux pump ArsB